MADENPAGALSEEQAVERLMKLNDEPVETEADEGTEDGTPEEVEAEAEGSEEPEDTLEEEEPGWDFDLPDGPRRLTKSEIEKGFLRQSDYTRKTMEAADLRKKADAELAETAALKQQLTERLQEWAIEPEQEPDWEAALSTHTAEEVLRAKAVWEKRGKQREKARQEWQALQQREAEATRAQEWGRLVEAVPEWADTERFKADYPSMAKVAGDFGFAAAEVEGIMDHRFWRVLKELSAYRSLQERKPAIEKKVAAAQPTLKPGPKPAQREEASVERQKLMARLRKSGGTDDDAAIALLMMK